MDAAFDAAHVRFRELLEQSAGSLRTVPADRFTGDLPSGLTEGEDAKRGALASVPCEARISHQAPHRQRTPANSDRRLLRITVEVRAVRTMAWAAQMIDAVRSEAEALALEDGDLIAQVFELPQNVRTTEAGASTGIISLMHEGSTPLVVGTTGEAQRIDTVHRFTGMMTATRDVAAAAVANTSGPLLGILSGEPAQEGSSLIVQPGVWANALTVTTHLLIDGVANVVSFPFEILAEHVGVSLQVRETATGVGGPVVALSQTITPT